MKVWITRPVSSEVHSGGLRSVRLWVERPRYDHRPLTYEFELLDSSGNYFATVYRELGWTTSSGSVLAKSFLKQSPKVYAKICELIYYSTYPKSLEYSPNTRLSYKEYLRLQEFEYELETNIHYKRFLAEIDLKSEECVIVHPEIVIDSPLIVKDWPITKINGLTDLFMDENMNKPFFYEEYSNYRTSKESPGII